MGGVGRVVNELQNAKTSLMIVDDESSVCRALSRILGKRVDEISVAFNPREAATVLASKNVTHVVCDHWFGTGQPLGIDLVTEWKEQYPSIHKVVVLTGTDVTRIAPQTDDILVMNKAVNPEDLRKALGLE